MNWKADYGERTDWGTGMAKNSKFEPLPTDIKLTYKQWDEIELLLLREIANLELVSDYDRSFISRMIRYNTTYLVNGKDSQYRLEQITHIEEIIRKYLGKCPAWITELIY